MGLIDTIKDLLDYEEQFKLIESYNEKQETALHSAVRNNNFEAIPLLLHRYVYLHLQTSITIKAVLLPVNSKKDAHLLRDSRGYTPLMIAAECGHLQSFEALLNHSSHASKQKKKLLGYD